MSERQHRCLIAVVWTVGMLSVTGGCTAIQIREHTRESYRKPSYVSAPVTRVLSQQRDRVFAQLRDWLRTRSVEIEDEDAEAGRIVADLRFGSDDAQRESVEMGSVRTVITRTSRRYLSYWPFEAGCDECIIRRGNLLSSETELVRDQVVKLSASDYQIAALLRAELSEVQDGTLVELTVGFRFHPRSPSGVTPVSTGRLEEAVLQALEQSLAVGPAATSVSTASSPRTPGGRTSP